MQVIKDKYKGFRLALFVLLYCFSYSHGDLYNSSDPMVLLNVTNFYDTVLGTPNGWIIEFYSSWCGHCIKFAPTWREFSYQVIDWVHTIKVAALDCADKENGPICRDYEVQSYPTIRLFGAYVQEGDFGLHLTKKDVRQLQEAMIDFIIAEEELNNGADTWANLLKYEHSVENIFEYASEEAVHAAIIVEEANSRVGSHSILDLGNYPMVYLRRMDGESPELNFYDLPSLPAVIVVDRAGNIEVLRKDVTTREELTALIIHHLNLKRRMFDSDFRRRNSSKPSFRDEGREPTVPLKPLESTDKVYMVDIENSLSYAFRHEVSLHKTISGEALRTLVNFTDVLVKYLPARKPVHQFLVNMNDYLKTSQVLEGEDYEKSLEYLQSIDSILPESRPWKGCLGSEPKYRRYPCGLWTLFHTLTVNAVLRAGDDPTYDPMEVMRAIHGYVKYYFGCQHCSQHFQEMYAEDAEDFVRRPNDEIVWLWKGHNKVNKRLKGDLSEDPQHPKRLFPTRRNCPKCWKNDGSFKLEEVLNYLKEIYGELSISNEGTEDLSKYDTRFTPDTSGTNNLFNALLYYLLSVWFPEASN